MPDEEQKDLPKPELDLPLPKKEIESGKSDLDEIETEIETKIEENVAASTPQQNPEISQTEDNSSKNQNLLKYLIISLLFLVTVAFVGIEFYLMKNKSNNSIPITSIQSPSPTPNPTANWQTYSNNDYSIKYDSSWTVDTEKDPSITSIFDPKSLESITGNGENRYILPKKYLTIKLKNSIQAPTEYANKIELDLKKINPTFEATKFTIGELSGMIYPETGEGSTGYNIIFSNGNKIAIINIPVNDPKKDETIWNMLSSFKFISLNANPLTEQSKKATNYNNQ